MCCGQPHEQDSAHQRAARGVRSYHYPAADRRSRRQMEGRLLRALVIEKAFDHSLSLSFMAGRSTLLAEKSIFKWYLRRQPPPLFTETVSRLDATLPLTRSPIVSSANETPKKTSSPTPANKPTTIRSFLTPNNRAPAGRGSPARIPR